MKSFSGWVTLSAVGMFAAALSACSSSSGGVATGSHVGGGAGGQGGSGGGSDAGVDSGGSAGSISVCNYGDKQCNGSTIQTCSFGGQWVDGTKCPFTCKAGDCAGDCAPASTQCAWDGVQTCGTDGKWQAAKPCQFGCDNGTCRTSCNSGDFHCNGNQVEQCNPGPPSSWTPTGTTCNAASGQKCDATTGTCQTLSPIGGTTPTGTYYQYAVFQTGQTAFLGGYDVDSFGDYIYVNRSSAYLNVYKVTLLDSDGDGKLEPNQHPQNPNNTGPIETRQLTLVKTLTKSGDGVPLGTSSRAELYALSDRIDMLGPSHDGIISEFNFASKTSSVIVQPTTTIGLSQFGFGDADGRWYAGSESARRVFSYDTPSKSWVAEFDYPNLAGSHMDGMEVVVAPTTGDQYVYISDMTSDFIAQYHRDPTGWVQSNLYQYSDTTGSPVEGFGFGALDHFWVTSGTYLYEIGGGDIQKYLSPCTGGKQECGTNGKTCPSTQSCVNGCCETIG